MMEFIVASEVLLKAARSTALTRGSARDHLAEAQTRRCRPMEIEAQLCVSHARKDELDFRIASPSSFGFQLVRSTRQPKHIDINSDTNLDEVEPASFAFQSTLFT